jgi:hypothetical protein
MKSKKMKMYAVPVDALNAILFSPKAPPKGYEEYHGKGQKDVSFFDDPLEDDLWPEDGELPHVILAKSEADSKEYKVFKSLNQFRCKRSGLHGYEHGLLHRQYFQPVHRSHQGGHPGEAPWQVDRLVRGRKTSRGNWQDA